MTVSYEGRLSDGTVFDTTETPIAMTVGTLVPGFNQGLMKMRPGGTYRLVIPAEMGYGREGIPGVIPGNAALDFTVTLQ
ncbi:MAG: FKBP-type peptidyl-prolyl cis-trans isomerase [Muribaculaceae bacterium]|nr:FKBP-type peptidyl-prolyl cis-trans isomerase [Muribaculaceae bacterium]